MENKEFKREERDWAKEEGFPKRNNCAEQTGKSSTFTTRYGQYFRAVPATGMARVEEESWEKTDPIWPVTPARTEVEAEFPSSVLSRTKLEPSAVPMDPVLTVVFLTPNNPLPSGLTSASMNLR